MLRRGLFRRREPELSDMLRDPEGGSFFEEVVLARLGPLLLALLFALAASYVIVQGPRFVLIPLVLLIPATIIFLRYPFVALLIWIAVYPFLIDEPFPGSRYIGWLSGRFMIPGALAVVILSGWLGLRKSVAVRPGRAELAILLLAGLGIANIVLLTPDPAHMITRYYDRLLMPLAMYWLVRVLSPGERDLRLLAWAGLFVIIAQAIIGVISWYAPYALPEVWLKRVGERTIGTFGNPAVYTSTLIFLGLLLLQTGMQSSTRRVRALGLAALALVYFCVFISFSRGSWLGATLVWIGLMFVYPKVIVRWTVALLVVMTILGSSLLLGELSWAVERLQDEDTAQGRVLGAATSLNMIAARPWLGWGFGTYDLYDEQYKERVGDLAMRDQQTSHNTFLLLAAEMGVFSLILYVLPTIWWLLLSKKIWRRLPQHGMKSRHLLALLWLFILDHLIVSNFMDMIQDNIFGTTLYWMVLGMIASLLYPYLRSQDTDVPYWISEAQTTNDWALEQPSKQRAKRGRRAGGPVAER